MRAVEAVLVEHRAEYGQLTAAIAEAKASAKAAADFAYERQVGPLLIMHLVR
jgi:hypothetical protein